MSTETPSLSLAGLLGLFFNTSLWLALSIVSGAAGLLPWSVIESETTVPPPRFSSKNEKQHRRQTPSASHLLGSWMPRRNEDNGQKKVFAKFGILD